MARYKRFCHQIQDQHQLTSWMLSDEIQHERLGEQKGGRRWWSSKVRVFEQVIEQVFVNEYELLQAVKDQFINRFFLPIKGLKMLHEAESAVDFHYTLDE